MRYQTEAEFVKDLMPLIMGGLIDGKTQIGCFAEVPRSPYNNHSDILLVANKEVLIIEFKLDNYWGLQTQIGATFYNGSRELKKIGIINKKLNEKENNPRILQYTGLDTEIDKIIQFIHRLEWTSILHNTFASIYYWAYLKSKNNFNGGIQSGERISFYEVYMLAIKHLLEAYPGIDFYVVYSVLGFYSESVARKYYNAVIKKNFNIYGKQYFYEKTKLL